MTLVLITKWMARFLSRHGSLVFANTTSVAGPDALWLALGFALRTIRQREMFARHERAIGGDEYRVMAADH